MFTVSNEVAKVMFIHLSVSHSVHRGVGGGIPSCTEADTLPPPKQTPRSRHPRADTPSEQTPRSRPPWNRPHGADPPEQTPPANTPQSRHPPGETATAVDSTHPTGMHSCFTGVCDSVQGGGSAWQGGMHAGRGVVHGRGACMAGSMCGRGHALQGASVADPGFPRGGGANIRFCQNFPKTA